MISLLLVTRDQKKAEEHAKNMFLAKGINIVDITVTQYENAIGIEDIREIQKKLFLKPLKSVEKVLIIPNMQTASTEAQNALLKVLEEPPINTSIVLLSTGEKLLLPTILSRCKIEILDDKNKQINEQEENVKAVLKNISKAPIGEKLAIAQKISEDKTEAISFLTTAITILRNQMLEKANKNQPAITDAKTVERFQKALTLTSTTNIAIRMILEDLFFHL